MIDEAHLKEGEENPVLGPHYFAARDTARKFMERLEPEQFEPLVKRVADEFYSKALEAIQAFLLSDLEYNLQSALWHGVDYSVEALLSGKKWALERYALNIRGHDGEEIRAAIAKHIPTQILDQRIADLENHIKDLNEQLRWARR